MNFDFSHLYNTEPVAVKNARGDTLFTAVVREITHGEKTAAQAAMMADITVPTEGSKDRRKREMKEQMTKAMKNGVSANVSLHEELSAIQSWTLKDAKGADVPVCADAWKALPAFLSKQITDVIERLNPEIDEDFQG
jgi:hypothetical protein